MSNSEKIKELEKRIEKLEKLVLGMFYQNAADKRGRLNGMGERPF